MTRIPPCRRVRLTLVFVLVFLVVSLQAGEAPEHWHLVYAAVRAAGLSASDAKLVADASWAVDQNDDTVATGHMDELTTWGEQNADRELRGMRTPGVYPGKAVGD